jgi:hypothetical protein
MERPVSGRRDFWWGVLWVARILALAVVACFALIGMTELARGGTLFTATDAFWVALFPFGVCLGYVIAWRRQLLGAMIAGGCLAVLYGGGALVGQRPPVVPILWPFGGPVLLFLYYWAFAPDARYRCGA